LQCSAATAPHATGPFRPVWPVTFLVMAWRRIQHQTGELLVLRPPEIAGMKLEITRLSTVLPTVGQLPG
jgi:hypothetical protein